MGPPGPRLHLRGIRLPTPNRNHNREAQPPDPGEVRAVSSGESLAEGLTPATSFAEGRWPRSTRRRATQLDLRPSGVLSGIGDAAFRAEA